MRRTTILGRAGGVPIIAASRIRHPDSDTLAFWCEYCHCRHIHSAGGPGSAVGDGDGHRVAHCHVDESPFRDGGYILREVKPPVA